MKYYYWHLTNNAEKSHHTLTTYLKLKNNQNRIIKSLTSKRLFPHTICSVLLCHQANFGAPWIPSKLRGCLRRPALVPNEIVGLGALVVFKELLLPVVLPMLDVALKTLGLGTFWAKKSLPESCSDGDVVVLVTVLLFPLFNMLGEIVVDSFGNKLPVAGFCPNKEGVFFGKVVILDNPCPRIPNGRNVDEASVGCEPIAGDNEIDGDFVGTDIRLLGGTTAPLEVTTGVIVSLAGSLDS